MWRGTNKHLNERTYEDLNVQVFVQTVRRVRLLKRYPINAADIQVSLDIPVIDTSVTMLRAHRYIDPATLLLSLIYQKIQGYYCNCIFDDVQGKEYGNDQVRIKFRVTAAIVFQTMLSGSVRIIVRNVVLMVLITSQLHFRRCLGKGLNLRLVLVLGPKLGCWILIVASNDQL